MDDGNHGNSGFLRRANERGTRCLCGDIALNGIQAGFYGRNLFLAVVCRPSGDEGLGNLAK